MIPRYARPEMSAIWSEEHRFRLMLQVELAALDALAAEGIVPAADAAIIKRSARLNVERIREIEAVTKHDIAAFVDQLSESVNHPAAKWIHFGLTSSDVLDTATGLQLKLSGALLQRDLAALHRALNTQARTHRDTVMMGRTHGMHAEPITFGFKLRGWAHEITEHRRMLAAAIRCAAVGKLSGVVGTYSQLHPRVEARVMRALGLAAEPIATQVTPRYRIAYFASALACIAASLERFATEIRHLQRTELMEAEEPFSRGQKGSSAMPHKRNPIGSENLCGMARLLRAYALTSFENVALWHERDISHSSVERITLPDMCIGLDYMLHRFTGIITNLVVYPETMRRNMACSHNVFFSQSILSELIRRGMPRDDAYRTVQRAAHEAILRRKDFLALIRRDPHVRRSIPAKRLAEICSLAYLLRHTGATIRD